MRLSYTDPSLLSRVLGQRHRSLLHDSGHGTCYPHLSMVDTTAAHTQVFRADRLHSLAEPIPGSFAELGGRIIAIGTTDDLAARFPNAARTDFGDGVIVPG